MDHGACLAHYHQFGVSISHEVSILVSFLSAVGKCSEKNTKKCHPALQISSRSQKCHPALQISSRSQKCHPAHGDVIPLTEQCRPGI